jgi:hemolysin activation/secretion protein
VALFAAAVPAWAQSRAPGVFRPDAGTILNLYAPPTGVPVLPASSLPKPPDAVPTAAASDVRIRIYSFEIEGVTLLPTAEVEAQLAWLIGQEASLDDLRLAAARVTALYRERGYFLARAYVPAQRINGGGVRIAVLEGRLDRVEASGSARLGRAQVEKTLTAHGIVSGEPIEQQSLERSLILLEQRAGAPARAVLQPGASIGTSSLQVEVPPDSLFNSTLVVDNFGSRYTGQGRSIVSVQLNSPLGLGDFGDVWAAYSTGAQAVFVSYQVPVGHDGLTLGASYSDFSYELCCEFAALDRAGDAAVAAVHVRYPLLLSQRALLHAGFSLERKRLTDTWSGGDLEDRELNVAVLSLDGVASTRAGQVRYQVALMSGDQDLIGPPDFIANNAATTDTAGRYSKLSGQVELLHALGESSFLSLRLSGQITDRNLDSAEKYLLGGYNGVRAYPEGEAAGDEALLARLEWARPLQVSAIPGQATIRAFVDTGSVWLVADQRGGLADPGIPNHYSLSGAGLGCNWNLPRGFSLSAYVATKIGDNPGRSAAGNDADGENSNLRGWVGAQWVF